DRHDARLQRSASIGLRGLYEARAAEALDARPSRLGDGGLQCRAKVGDRYRYEWRNTASGHQFGNGGVCREFSPRERIVVTETMDGQPGEALVTTTLVEQNGKTTLTLNILFESREIRDIALKSGMERGVAASYDRLDQVLAPGAAGAASHGCA